MSGRAAITAERSRQISEEGYSKAHDDGHRAGELAIAGACYMQFALEQVAPRPVCHPPNPLALPEAWPWSAHCWKASPHPRRNLVKAGALFLAESHRLSRARDLVSAKRIMGLAIKCAHAIDQLAKEEVAAPTEAASAVEPFRVLLIDPRADGKGYLRFAYAVTENGKRTQRGQVFTEEELCAVYESARCDCAYIDEGYMTLAVRRLAEPYGWHAVKGRNIPAGVSEEADWAAEIERQTHAEEVQS